MAGGEHDEMTCQELVEVVTAYLDGVLPDSDRARLEAHVAECPYCEEYIAQMRVTVKVLGRLQPDPIDPVRERELLEAFRGWRVTRAPPGRRNRHER
jgi:anti-sigma factor RsiW